MAYFATAFVSFFAGVIITLIFRIPVEKKLAAEREAMKASVEKQIGKL